MGRSNSVEKNIIFLKLLEDENIFSVRLENKYKGGDKFEKKSLNRENDCFGSRRI